MNEERLIQVAEWLEAGAPERKFNMNRLLEITPDTDTTNWCGTECCIAGYVVTRYAPEQVSDASLTGSSDYLARDLLELDRETADDLFYPKNRRAEQLEDWSAITPEQAALVVRNLLKHGEVDWEIIL